MNLFKSHTKQNENNAKQALVAVATRTLGKYMICQQMLNSALANGTGDECLHCKIDAITKKMAKFEGQVGEIAKTYQVMFGEELDVKGLTVDALKEFYPLAVNGPQPINWDGGRRKGKEGKAGTVEGKWKDNPKYAGSPSWAEKQFKEDYGTTMPQEVRDTINTIKETLEKQGKGGVEVRVMRVPVNEEGMTFGLNPKDFESFEDFYAALKQRAHEMGMDEIFDQADFIKSFESRPAEEVIKDSVIHKAEEEAAKATAEATEEKKKSPRGGKKHSKNNPKGNKKELIN